MSVSVEVGQGLSYCDTTHVTNRLVNIGGTLNGLYVTNELPDSGFVYVPGQTQIKLPDGTILSGNSADPVISVDKTSLSWDFSTVSGAGGVNHLLISEIFYYATNSPDFDVAKFYQWFEIFNPTPAPIVLENAYVKDAQPGQKDALPTMTIGPGQFVVVAASTNHFLENFPGFENALYEIIDPSSNGIGNGLNFYMDGVGLYDSADNLIDGASYGASTTYLNPPFPQVAAAHSMARDPANTDTGAKSDWKDLATPTPGSGRIESGINNGDEIEIVYELEIECGVLPGNLKATAVFQQPPGSTSSTNTVSALINPRPGALVVEMTPILQSRRYMEEFTWTLTVRNEGFGRAANVTVRDVAGPGIELLGFDVTPTTEINGQSAVWDKSALPELASLDVGEQVSIVVTARAVSCSGLYNDMDAAWGCEGFSEATDSVCNDTELTEGTARATLDFISEPPRLSGAILPGAPIQVDYCAGSEITITVSNAADAGPARNIALLPVLPAGFTLVGDDVTSSNTIHIGDLDPDETTNVVVRIIPDNCPVPLDRQDLLMRSGYEDLCGEPFSALGLLTSFQVCNEPGASIVKTIPSALYGAATPVTASVHISFFYTNFTGTSVTIQDKYPRDLNSLIQVANVSPPADDDGAVLTWSPILSGSGVYTAVFDLVVSASAEDQCHTPDVFLENILLAPPFVDCQGCVKDVPGNGQSYPFAFYPASCGGTGGCSYASSKAPGAELIEACSPAINTQRFFFAGDVALTATWAGVFFYSDLAGGVVDTDAVRVFAGSVDVTSYTKIEQTSPQLQISFEGLTNTPFIAPSALTNSYLDVVWAASVTNIGRVLDHSWLVLPGCSGRGARSEWTQGESVMDLAMNSVTNFDACGISTLCVTLTNLPSPGVPGLKSAPFPAYDVRLVVDLDADGDLNSVFEYMTNSAVFSDMLAPDNSPISSIEPSVDGNQLTWDIGDLASNGAGRVYFNVRSSCALVGENKYTARLEYNTRCHDNEEPRARQIGAFTNSVPFLFNALLSVKLQPEYTFLTSTQYPTRIEVLNTGPGVAYNVRPELYFPTNIKFGVAGVAPLSVTETNAVWGDFASSFGDLQDLDGDGQADDLPPNGSFNIWVTNHVTSCAEQTVLALARQGCKGEDCETPPEAHAQFTTAAGQLVTDLKFPTTLVVCSNGTASFSIRNAGIVDAMDVSMILAIPEGVTYMAGSSRYVHQDITNSIITEPSGTGTIADPLVWTPAQVPLLSKLCPTQTVTILFDFPIACESTFGPGMFTMLTEHTDICGRTKLIQQALVNSVLNEPELSVSVKAGTNAGSYFAAQIVRDPNEPIVYQVTIDHTPASQAPIGDVLLTFKLPDNVSYQGATPAPSSVSGVNGAILTWSAAALGTFPYNPEDAALEVIINAKVEDCYADSLAVAEIEYGCSETNRCMDATSSHSLRTLPSIPALSPKMGLDLNTCGGHLRIAVTNVGATATGLVMNVVAPNGYIFAGASLAGSFHAANAVISLSGIPNGSEAMLDLTTQTSSGASATHDTDGDAETLELIFSDGFVVDFELVSAGGNLDCLANPLDTDYTDPDPPLPSQVSADAGLEYWSICGGNSHVDGNINTYPDMPDPDIDLQPNCSTVTNGQVVNFTLNLRNDAQRGNAENLYIRVQFGEAWTNVSMVSSTMVESASGHMECELTGNTALLVDLPGVSLDPIDDHITLNLQATVGNAAGSLAVLAEVVGDCNDSRVIAQCVFTNTLGDPALADTLEGATLGQVNGQYYGFDQDMSGMIGFGLEKTVRLAAESLDDASTNRSARIGEEMLVHLKATFFGNVFSNIVVSDSLPHQLFFGTPINYSYSGNILSAAYDPVSGAFTITPQALNAYSPATFEVDIPITVSNRADNQNAAVITNLAACIFEVNAFTNQIPPVSALINVLEPELTLSKKGGTNKVSSGQIVWFTNVISHTAQSATNAYNMVFRDNLPQGLTFAGIDLANDGIDNNGNGDVDEPLEASLIKSETLIEISYADHPGLVDIPMGESRTFIFAAVVTNQIIGGVMTNSANITWMSLETPNGNERTGVGGMNDYATSSVWAVRSLPLGEATKVFVKSSQTNTHDGNTNDLTIGERIVYSMTVNVPEGVISNMTITDLVPKGMDWVGPNPDTNMTYPGFGYSFFVPPNGPQIPTNVAEGLVITDTDPTPASSTTLDGSGSNIVFRFPPFTNTVDGNAGNDYFILNMEFVLLDAPINTGLSPSPFTDFNKVVVTDAFNSVTATGPCYRVVEPDLRLSKQVSPQEADAGDTITVTLVISNAGAALSAAYHVSVTDFLDSAVFDINTISDQSVPENWGVSNNAAGGGLIHYFYSKDDLALIPGECVTNIFTINLAKTVAPSRVYLNEAAASCNGLHDSPPGGIAAREDQAAAQANFRILAMKLDKSLYATSEGNNPPDSTGNNVQVGEVVTYELAATLPESTIKDLTFTDIIPTGMAFVVDSVVVDTGTFNGTLPGAPDVTPAVGRLGDNGGLVVIKFTGDTWVRDDADPSMDVLKVRLSAIVLDTNSVAGLPASSRHTNSASLTYDGNPVAPTSSGFVVVSVIEPLISLQKSISSNQADAGDTITVTFVVTNSGTAAAYDLQIVDPLLPAKLDPATVVNGTVPAGFVMVASNNALYVRSDPNASPTQRALEPQGSRTFTFSAKVAAGLPPNAVITNTATAQADSLSGTNLYAVQRYYGSTSSASYTAGNFSLAKRLYSTSEHNNPPDSTGNDVQIGEIVTYELEALLPEGTIRNLTFKDFVPEGMAFVVGSVVVDTGSFDGTLATTTNITPNIGEKGGNGEDVEIVFQGDTWVRDDNDPNNDILKIRLSCVVLNNPAIRGLPPQSLLANTASITYTDNPAEPVVTPEVVMTVIEPNVAVQKQASTNSVDAGDAVVFTFIATNSGTASAYNLQFVDLLAPWFDSSTAEQVSVPQGFIFAVSNDTAYFRSDPDASPADNSLDPEESLEFSFRVKAAQSLPPNHTFTNSVRLGADTINGTNTLREWRSYSQTGDVVLAARNFELAKSIFADSEQGPADSTNAFAQIGEVFTFELAAVLPEGTIPDLTFTDTLPAGMAFVVDSLAVDTSDFNGTLPAATNVTPNAGLLGESGGPVTITFAGNTVVAGDNDPANNFLRLRIQAIVLDTNIISGLAPQSVLVNKASLTYAGNPSNAVESLGVSLTCIEPNLALTKTMSPDSGDAGDWITMTLLLTNSGTAAAYDLAVTDLVAGVSFDVSTIEAVVAPTGFVFSTQTLGSDAVVRFASDTNFYQPSNTLVASNALEFSFRARLAQTVLPGSRITNTARVASADTIYGTNIYAISRDKSGAQDEATITISNMNFAKLLLGTTETGPADTTGHDLAIGEAAEFGLRVELPEGTVMNLHLEDAVPLGMAYVPGSIKVYTNDFAGSLPGAPDVSGGSSGNPLVIEFNGATVVSNDNDPGNNFFIVSFQLRALDVASNDGIPVEAGGNGPTFLDNNATAMFDGMSGPMPSGTVTVRIVEPAPAMEKILTGPSNGWVNIGFSITNNGLATAFDLQLEDVLHTSIWQVASLAPVDVPTGFVWSVEDISTAVVLRVQSDPAFDPPTNAIMATSNLLVMFKALLQPGLVATITNVAAITNYTTLAGDSPHERHEPPLAATNTLNPPGVDLFKTLAAPSGREAEKGELVVFDILVTNTTIFGIADMRVEDAYPSNFLRFVSATIPPDSISPGLLVWTNLGPLAAGDIVQFSVSFEALAGTLPDDAVNSACVMAVTTNGIPIPPVTDNEPVTILNQSFMLNKQLAGPLGRPADLGEEIVFEICVTNNGDSTLATIDVDDAFDPAFMEFVSATPHEDSAGSGTIVWNNIGPLMPGDSTTLTVRFLAIAGTLPGGTTNEAKASAITDYGMPMPQQTSSAPVQIAVPGYVLSKTLISPVGRPAIVSETLCFAICVSNSGQTALGPLDLNDVYPTNTLRFLDAVPPVSGHDTDAGLITWTNLGYVAVGETACVTMRFEAIQANTPDIHTNTAIVEDLTTTNGLPVPPAKDEEPFQIDVPSALGGIMWYDSNINGLLDAEEPRLANLTVKLYDSQSNFVAQTLTGPDGGYLFTNLVSDAYSVLFDPLPGTIFTLYRQGASMEVNSAARDNGWAGPISLGVGQTNMFTHAGVYEPAHIFGLAWNDINANGIREPGEPLLSGAVVSLYTNGAALCSITTGADGVYAFTNLMPATYRIYAVVPEGFVISPEQQGADAALDSNYNPTNGWTAQIPLIQGQVVTNIDLGAFLPTAELSLAKIANSYFVLPGSNVTFTITLSNAGPNIAGPVEISEALGAGFEYVGHVGERYDHVTGVWSIAELGAGRSTSLWITVTVPSSGCFTNTARIALFGQHDTAPADNEASAVVCATNDTCPTLLSIAVTPAQGSWTLSGPPEFNGPISGSGNMEPLNVPPGLYTLQFDHIPGRRSPSTITRFMEECSESVLTGRYIRICGSGDFDGDGAADLTVYNRLSGQWYSMSADGRILIWAVPWGGPGMVPLRGDFDGDGISDLAVYAESTNMYLRSHWHILTTDGRPLALNLDWGCYNYAPVVADFNGDGACDLGVYKRDTGEWYIQTLWGEILAAAEFWGGTGFEPVKGDFDGDGAFDLAAFATAQGAWYAKSLNGSVLLWHRLWGAPYWNPLSAYYNADNITDLGVYDPANGAWYINPPDCDCPIAWNLQFGGPEFLPVIGDYDADGIDDLAVYHEKTGLWYGLSLDGRILFWALAWGGTGYTAVR